MSVLDVTLLCLRRRQAKARCCDLEFTAIPEQFLRVTSSYHTTFLDEDHAIADQFDFGELMRAQEDALSTTAMLQQKFSHFEPR